MNDDRLLDEAALARLTGRRRKSLQIKWLLNPMPVGTLLYEAHAAGVKGPDHG